MPRSVQSDFLQSMRFTVDVSTEDGSPNQLRLARTDTTAGSRASGFSMCSVPSASVNVVDYREGTYNYTRRQPGIPTMEAITLSRGVVITDTTFFDWMRQVLEGSGNYRANIVINHFHRDAGADKVALNQKFPFTSGTDQSLTDINKDAQPARKYLVYEAFPSSCKPAGDLDANSDEINIAELTVEYEHFDVVG